MYTHSKEFSFVSWGIELAGLPVLIEIWSESIVCLPPSKKCESFAGANSVGGNLATQLMLHAEFFVDIRFGNWFDFGFAGSWDIFQANAISNADHIVSEHGTLGYNNSFYPNGEVHQHYRLHSPVASTQRWLRRQPRSFSTLFLALFNTTADITGSTTLSTALESFLLIYLSLTSEQRSR